MKHWIVTGILGVAWTLNIGAVVRDNSYGVIAQRNPFALRPAPVIKPAEPEPAPLPPPPEIKITGITTLLGMPVVTLQYEDKETKQVEFPPLLFEGRGYKKLVVQKIDIENQVVVIRNGEALTTLDFVTHGVKPVARTAASAVLPSVGSPVPPTAFYGAPSSTNRVLVAGAPTSTGPSQPHVRPQMTPEQARAYLENFRRKQQAEGAPPPLTAPPIFPPGVMAGR